MYTVYLIHLERPLGKPQSDEQRALYDLPPSNGGYKAHGRHYLGVTADLEARLKRHREGNGARMLAAANRQDIPWKLARAWQFATWERAIQVEHKLKAWHGSQQFCPLCTPDAMGRANYE